MQTETINKKQTNEEDSPHPKTRNKKLSYFAISILLLVVLWIIGGIDIIVYRDYLKQRELEQNSPIDLRIAITSEFQRTSILGLLTFESSHAPYKVQLFAFPDHNNHYDAVRINHIIVTFPDKSSNDVLSDTAIEYALNDPYRSTDHDDLERVHSFPWADPNPPF